MFTYKPIVEESSEKNITLRRTVLKKGLFLGLAALSIPILASKQAHAGARNCSLCPCPAFQGSTYICDNCGHQYTAHW
jgi:hypothetical protein